MDVTPRRPAPLIGQHNGEIALTRGYSCDDIESMRRDGVLFPESAT